MPKGGGNRGKGKGIAWLREHVDHSGDECLIWPFSRHPTGYAQFSFEGKMFYAHRWMCAEVNGPAPTPEHQAAHSCGNGHNGCIHQKHLLWKTPLSNSRDKIAHGTCYTNKGRRRNKLTQEQVDEIRKVRTTAEQHEIAKRFGVSASMIRKIIYGKAWKPIKPWTDLADDDVRRIRSMKGAKPAKVLAREYGVPPNVIYKIWNGARAYVA